MNYKQLLIDSQKSGVSALLEFVLQYHNFDKVVASFVEGKDYPYYRTRVFENVNHDNEILFYPCNGKHEVELVKKMINSNLHLKNDVKVLYFCDKDYGLDDIDKEIFYTDYYSVENYYSTEEFISNVLNNIFNINKYNPEYQICLNLYKEKYKKFNEQMRKINAYCYGIRINEKNNFLARTDLNILKLRDFLENENFAHFQVKEFNYENIKSILQSKIVISNEEYAKYLKEIDQTKLRGKWELQFIIWFLEGIRKEIKNGGSGLVKNNRNIISFQNEIMTSMEKYATTSNSLIEYITSNT